MVETITNSILYVFLFLTLYFEVFLLITFFEERENIHSKPPIDKLSYYPKATIIVPCWNEEKTVSKTVHSLLNLNYPKNRFEIIIVDDGSTDRTWDVVQKFKNNPQIKLVHKENGGKHTAVNFGIEHSDAEIVGCLDADSYVHKDALREVAFTFNSDKSVMAVIPSIIVHEPKTIFQKMQKTEYNIGVFLRRILSSLDAIQVTPGPFSFIRREVFEKIGMYKHAHNTEDMEFALRMQSNQMRIRNAHFAYVYTTAPDTLYKLYRQRLRWVYGTLKNTLDYRFMMFKREYGILGMFTLPLSFLAVFVFLYNFSFVLFHVVRKIVEKIIEISVTGLTFALPNFDAFYVNTDFMAILGYIFLGLALVIIWNGTRMAEARVQPTMGIFYFLVLYGIVAPLWLSRAVFNLFTGLGTKWR